MSDRLSLTHVTGLSFVGTEHEQQGTLRLIHSHLSHALTRGFAGRRAARE